MVRRALCALLLLGLAASSVAFAEDAAQYFEKGIAALKEAENTPSAIVDAALFFSKAQKLCEAAGQEDKTAQADSYLYLCKKRMKPEDVEAFNKQVDAGSAKHLNDIAAAEQAAPAEPPFPRSAKPAVNVLKAFNPAEQPRQGEWSLLDGVLQCRKAPVSNIPLPFHPGADYDLHLVFKRLTGGDNVGIILVFGAQQVVLNTQGSNNFAGLSQVDGMRAADNPSGVPNSLVNGAAYDLLVLVRGTIIFAALNGKTICSFDTKGHKLSVESANAIADRKALGIITKNATLEFSKIEITDAGGDGHFVKVVNTLAPHSAAAGGVKGRVVNVLEAVDPRLDALQASWSAVRGELRSNNSGVPLFRLPFHPGTEYDLRISFVRDTGNDDVAIILPINGSHARLHMGGWGNTLSGLDVIDGSRLDKTASRTEAGLTNGSVYELKAQVRKGSVTATLNGQTICDVKLAGQSFSADGFNLRDERALGMYMWNSNAAFKAIELTDFSGTAEFYRPSFVEEEGAPQSRVVERHEPPPPIPRVAIPSAESQRESEKIIRELYKGELLAAAAREKLALAEKLDRQAADSRDDPAARFVLLSISATLIAQAGELEKLLAAFDTLAAQFDGDTKALRKTCLANASTATRDPSAAKAIGALRALIDNPADAVASQSVGKYFCFIANRWERGLPYMAKSSFATLQALAQSELSPPADSLAQFALAEKWWAAAQKSTDKEEKGQFLDRASYWYSIAAPGLTGVSKAKAETRIRTPSPSQPAAAADGVLAGTVWTGGNYKLIISERKGETFKGTFEMGIRTIREVSGTIKDGKLSWLPKDVRAIRGSIGGEQTGIINGDVIEFTSRDDTGTGSFTLRKKAN